MGQSFISSNGGASNGNSNGNGNERATVKKISGYFLSKLFNIAPSQWQRVIECWLITFFFKIGSAIGWTVLTAAFVARFGITFLPTLFVINAICIMAGTVYFEKLIMRMKREVLMILMLLIGAICLFFASVVYDKSYSAFFALIIAAESVFFAQFNVFIPILVGDRFTPLESQKTFPFIESAETIGSMIGAGLVGIFAIGMPINLFLYGWIFFLTCVIAVFVTTNHFRIGLPPLPLRANKIRTRSEIAFVIKGIKKISFLKGLVLIVLLQWVFMNVLEFQYTKAVEQSVTHTQEQTIAKLAPKMLTADVMDAGENSVQADNNSDLTKRALSKEQEARLTVKLGVYKGLFHAIALIIQVFLASRIISSLGIIKSLLLHPIIMLMSLVGMFMKFGFSSSLISRSAFEATNVVHKNAYFASHYALPKSLRDQAAEFLEGVVRPMGTIVGMLLILILQIAFSGRELSMWIHMFMFVIMIVILLYTLKLQPKYTRVTQDQLFSDIPYPDKLNAIEILAQKGHENAARILVRKFSDTSGSATTESSLVRVKLLNALGRLCDYQTLPHLLNALYDEDSDIRLEAAYALMNFGDIGVQFYSQAFSRYRMIETLKDVFKKETSATVRGAIVRVFSLIRQSDIVPFLLEILYGEDPHARADCIFTLGLFKDPAVVFYILPFLYHGDPMIKGNAIAALWHFPEYRPMLENKLDELLSGDQEAVRAGLFAAGEVRCGKKCADRRFLENENEEIRLEAAYALAKCENALGFYILLDSCLDMPSERFESLRRFFHHRLSEKARHSAERVLLHYISSHLRSLQLCDQNVLERLRRLYRLLDQHEDLYFIEKAMESSAPKNETAAAGANKISYSATI